jgi:vacuolar-type H+-ATPase subunit D/Vma8
MLRAVRRLERLSKGADLLRRKREALVTELFRLARPAADANANRRRGASRVSAPRRALAEHGLAGVRAIGWPREIFW